MKKILLLNLLVLLCTISFAQNRITTMNLPQYDFKRWHFGFSVGYNQRGFLIDKNQQLFTDKEIYGIESIKHHGFHLGPISDLKLNNYFHLRMLFDLSFNQRDLDYYLYNGEDIVPHRMSITSTLLELPIAIKFRGQRFNNNVSPYMIAGVTPHYDLAAKNEAKVDELPKIKLEPIDITADFGAGFDIFCPFFKLSIEAKYVLGLTNILEPDGTPYTAAINKLRSNGFMFTLHFE